MKVILKEDVENLGKIGDILTVKPGYARNFLFPKKLAAEADTKNIKAFEHEKRVAQERARKVGEQRKTLAEKISGASVTIKAKAGEEDKIFGSVTSMDIAEALKGQELEVDKKKIVIDEPIKRLGEHEVTIKVSSDVSAKLKVQVVADES